MPNYYNYLLLAARKRRSVECGDNGESNDKDGCDCNDGFEFDGETCTEAAGKILPPNDDDGIFYEDNKYIGYWQLASEDQLRNVIVMMTTQRKWTKTDIVYANKDT